MPTDPNFEALAEKLNATVEPEPVPPLPEPVMKGRGGVPRSAQDEVNAMAIAAPRPSSPFGAGVEVTDSAAQPHEDEG